MTKVLIVDDDPDILEVLQITMEMEGFETRTITRGEEVFKEITIFKPDVIILDILLSGSDGRYICKKIKSEPKLNDIPIILISALPNAEDTIKGTGANDFVPKPFDIEDLLTKVERQLTH